MDNKSYSSYAAHHTTITAKRSLFDLNLKELWQYRDLIGMFVKKDFSLIYKQTILGPAWISLVPFITTVIYTVVFGNIAHLSTDGVPKQSGNMNSNVSPYMCPIGSIDTILSLWSTWTAPMAKSTIALKHSFLSITPFGALVVPEV